MFKPGMVCLKTAGRDAGKYCVVLTIKDNYALIEGYTRRRKCNIKHLEPLGMSITLPKNIDQATKEFVVAELKKLGLVDKDYERALKTVEKLKAKGVFRDKSKREKSVKPVRRGAVKKVKVEEQKKKQDKKEKKEEKKQGEKQKEIKAMEKQDKQEQVKPAKENEDVEKELKKELKQEKPEDKQKQ
ncbi:hypothetical protein J7L02_03200 [Candidatus Woesearchaeota archaeon]|nr:hypothetical protein [Candidatus Woesearchaeota archaeon]